MRIQRQPSAAKHPKTISLNISAAALLWLIAALPSLTAEAQTKLLFRSGFESGTTLSTPGECSPPPPSGGNWTCWQTFSGTDNSTNQLWPPVVWNSTITKLHLIAEPNLEQNHSQYFANALVSETGRGTVLRSKILADGGGATQSAFEIHPSKDFNPQGDLHISYWMKFQNDFVEKMKANTNRWRIVFEWKTGNRIGESGFNSDYRVQLAVVNYSGSCMGNNDTARNLFWRVEGQPNLVTPNDEEYDEFDPNKPVPPDNPNNLLWRVDNCNVPVTGNWSHWFKLEIFWHRSTGTDGRVWIAVNDNVIADRLGKNMVKAPINRIMVNNLYSNTTSWPIEQWIDDLEIWSSFPPSWLPAVLPLLLDE